MAGSALEDSLKSALDYEAEVAYISLTSPLQISHQSSHQQQDQKDDEFDFFTEEELEEKKDDASQHGPSATEDPQPDSADTQQTTAPVAEDNEGPPKPPLMSKLGSPRPPEIHPTEHSRDESEVVTMQSKRKKPKAVSPLTLSVPSSYTLDTALPSTPTSKLRRIKEAQAPPSPKPRPKLQQEEHLYCTLVVYGSTGCGRTQLVDKLALSNPSVFAKVVSTTTRKKRQNEVSGVDFHYLSHDEMASGIARGDFIEFIKVHRRGNTKREHQPLRRKHPTQISLPSASPPASSRRHLVRTVTDLDRKFGSLFDLTEEDSPVLGGEMFGTSHESLRAAVQLGKPCILLNVSMRGAQQLKQAGMQASYILIESASGSPKNPKNRHDSRIQRSTTGADSPRSRPQVTVTPHHIVSSDSLDNAYSDLHDYAFQLVGNLKLPSTSQYQVARYEWEAMPTVQFEQTHSLPSQKVVDVTFSEILAHFQTGSTLKRQIERAKAEQGKASLFLKGKLTKKLQNERLMVQALTYCQLNEKERLHLRILQTIYCKLTGNALTCRRFGPHWQEIGFSGVDPADDMDNVALLGPIQLIYFLQNPKTASLCKEIFKYCHKDTHIIPFVVMAFEFTALSLEALNNGILNKLCNKRDQVFVVVNEFYMAAFHNYYQQWKSSQKSILQLGLLMQQCADYCKTHPRQVMQEFDKCLCINQPQNQVFSTSLPKVEGTFTPFDDIKVFT